MPEIETFALVDRTAHPFTEIVVIQSALPLAVQVGQNLDQIDIVEAMVGSFSKEPHDVLRGYLTIFINVEIKKGLSNRDPVFLEPISQKLSQAI